MRATPHGWPIAAALLLLLLVPAQVEAHIGGARPILQRAQGERIVDVQPGPMDVEVDLQLVRDTLRHLVTHRIDPPLSGFYVEYRKDASVADDRYWARWDFERLVEFRDLNVNGLLEPSDTVVRSWRFDHYDWRRSPVQPVQVADVRGFSAVWEGNLTGAPSMRVEVAFTGKDFTDEGAVVRPQDVILYLDVTNLPPRGIGSLYAMELRVHVPRHAALSLHQAENTSTALLADAPMRRALLVWGGEAFLDGSEQRVDATIEDEQVGAQGNRTARLVIHMPTVDRSMNFVMVSGVEYEIEIKRTPSPAALALLAAALALGARRRR